MNIPYETKHQFHVKVTQKAARFVVDTVGLRLSDGDRHHSIYFKIYILTFLKKQVTI